MGKVILVPPADADSEALEMVGRNVQRWLRDDMIKVLLIPPGWTTVVAEGEVEIQNGLAAEGKEG